MLVSDPYDAWEPWRLPDVILSGGPSPQPCDDVTVLQALPECRPVGFTADHKAWKRRCARCDRLGLRGFTRAGDRWVCANTTACDRRRE